MSLRLFDFNRARHIGVLTPATLAKILGSSGMTLGTGTLVNGRSSTATVLCYAPGANPGDSQVITNCLVGEIRYSGARRVDLADGITYNAGVAGIRYYDTYANGSAISPKPAILAEPSATNIQLFSNSLSNYSTSNTSITSTTTVLPDELSGALTTAVENTANNIHSIFRTGIGSSGDITLTLYVKQVVGSRNVALNVISGANGIAHIFNLSTKTFISTATTSAGLSVNFYSISDAGNGYSKITVSVVATAAFTLGIELYNGATRSYVGDNTSSIGVYGLQIVQSKIESSYMPTTSSAFTRAVDGINIPYTANFADSIIFALRFNRSIASPTASAETYLSATGRTILAKSAAGTTLNLTDGTNTATVAIPGTTQTDYIFAFVADTALAQMAVLVSGDGGSTWTTSTTASYDDSFNGSSVLNLLPTIVAPTNIVGVMTKSQPFGSITAATDWIKANAATELS